MNPRMKEFVGEDEGESEARRERSLGRTEGVKG